MYLHLIFSSTRPAMQKPAHEEPASFGGLGLSGPSEMPQAARRRVPERREASV